MDVMKKKQMLATLVMLSLLQGSVYAKDSYYDEEKNAYYANGNKVVINDGDVYKEVYGNGCEDCIAKNINGANVTVNGGSLDTVCGASGNAEYMVKNNIVINGGSVEGVCGASGNAEYMTENKVVINGGEVLLIRGFLNEADDAIIEKNNLIINGVSGVYDFMGIVAVSGNIRENKIIINKVSNNEPFDFWGVTVNGENKSCVTDNEIVVKAGNYGEFLGYCGGNSEIGDNKLTISGDTNVNKFLLYTTSGNNITGNVLTLDGNSQIDKAILLAVGSSESKINNNDLILKGNSDVASTQLYGYYAKETTDQSDGTVPGLSLEEIKMPAEHKDNSLIIDGWTGQKIGEVNYFDDIEFKNFEWNTAKKEKNALVVITGEKNVKGENIGTDLSETDININRTNDGKNGIKLNSEQTINTGDSMTLIYSANGLGDIKALAGGKKITTNLGVAAALDAVIEQSEDDKAVNLIAKEIKLTDQTMLVAENRAVAAAFVNQGTDLIADSLDVLSRDGKYGVKTFAAVQGNRSKYDVNSDLKINGWSTIVGVGSETEHNGGDFSWGVFYENGSGNYRTFNSFNNEYFRGDGSLVYNGGGIAARYENAHGVYTEGSLRAGMLKSDMDNALSDGENKYGYSSESEYYGAHIGVGQIIPLTESSNLDVYGKFFHTYTEGDSFNVADDEFEFDGINSDRLRVGARLTTNKENKFSTYYGLAYEYEFNGEAEMRAAGMSAPTQSLQGSSCMAEIGFNYQPTPDSPWSFDLNMRGYAGQREGATFNVQATYTF